MKEEIENDEPPRKVKKYYNNIMQSIKEMILMDVRECKNIEEIEEIKKMETIYDSLNQINNSIYIEKIALSKLIKEIYISKVKKTTIADLSDYDIDYRNKVYIRVKPLIEALYILGIYNNGMTIVCDEPDEELAEYLRIKEFTEILTVDELAKFKDLLVRTLQKKEFNENFLVDIFLTYIMDYTSSNAFNIKFSKDFIKKLGHLSNNKIIDLYKIFKKDTKTPKNIPITPEDYVHDFLDINEILEKFEDGTITKEEKHLLQPKDYVYRFLQNPYAGEPNTNGILDKVKITTLIDMYKTRMISFDDLYILLTVPESRFSKCNSKDKERLKIELRKIYVIKKGDLQKSDTDEMETQEYKYATFTSTQLLKLAKIGLVSQSDMLTIYASQIDVRRSLLQEFKSSQLYENDPTDIIRQHEIITNDDMLEYFDAKKLIDIYLEKKKTNSLNKKTNNKKNNDFTFILDCCLLYMSVKDIERQILIDKRMKPEDIMFFYEKDIISTETINNLKLNNQDFKSELFSYVKQIEAKVKDIPEKNASEEIFRYFNKGILTEDDLIEMFDDRYEPMLREAFRKGYISIDKMRELSFLDHSIVMEEYNKSLQMHIEHPETFNQEQDFESMLDIYLLTEGLVNFEDIYKMVKERKDPVLQNENLDLGKYIYDIIVQDIKPAFSESELLDKNILISKIKELYMNSFLTDELNKLADDGVIGYETAKQIDDEFCASENYQQIWEVKLGDSDSSISSSSNISRSMNKKSVRTTPKPPSDKQILQADAMINYMTSIGFEPKTTTNAYGIEEMDTFDSGDFKNYRIFLSKENPRVVILVHLKQITNTDTYYHVGDNATYIMSSSVFLSYLKSSGRIDDALASFYATKSRAKNSIYTRTANVGKTWGRVVPKKICQIISALDNPGLQEMKNANFEITSIFPESLRAQDQQARLEQINKCLEELISVREINDE